MASRWMIFSVIRNEQKLQALADYFHGFSQNARARVRRESAEARRRYIDISYHPRDDLQETTIRTRRRLSRERTCGTSLYENPSSGARHAKLTARYVATPTSTRHRGPVIRANADCLNYAAASRCLCVSSLPKIILESLHFPWFRVSQWPRVKI